MTRSQFISHLEELAVADKIREIQTEQRRIEERISFYERVSQVIEGLQRTSTMRDPGKYGSAFYFVSVIDETSIYSAEQPVLYQKCTNCDSEQPVLMEYEQTYDSPDGDRWEKCAFILCADCKHEQKIATRASNGRF